MKQVLCLVLFVFAVLQVQAQIPLNSDDLTNFSASDLTSEEVSQLRGEMNSRGLSFDEFRAVCLSKGMDPGEFEVLRSRLTAADVTVAQDVAELQSKPNAPEHGAKKNTGNDGWVFGSEIFSNQALSFEPNQTLSNPAAYELGVGDRLIVSIYGVQQFTQTARVNLQGDIVLNNIGAIHVSGMQLGAASNLIRKKAGNIYNTLNSGRSELSVTISEFKTIQVTMIGVKQPGNYALSSLSTVFNALHVAGGPADNGSYRKIELIRDNELYKVIDLYDFLTEGDLSGNVALRQDDIIRVPVYTKRVTISGSVKRPGIFELLEDEGFNDLLRYSSGFADNAYTNSIQVTTTTDSEFKIKTIPNGDFETVALKSGDVVKVGELRQTFENRVSISGAVYRPENYELIEGMRISDLLEKADGLTPDAFGERALLLRKGERMIPEVIGVGLNQILNNPTSEENIELIKDDELIVSSILDLNEQLYVNVRGEVQSPGQFRYVENMSLYDLIIMAGGFNELASRKVEIARVVANDEKDTLGVDSEILSFEIDSKFESMAQDIELNAFDYVSIRRIQNFTSSQEVMISGEVSYPGVYIVAKENERVSDLLIRAGGLTGKANIDGVKIIRTSNPIRSSESQDVVIPIDYKKILNNPDVSENIVVRAGDNIYIERMVRTASVFGAVELPTEVPVKKGKSARYYINSAGGFKEDADKKRVYVRHANGLTKTTKRFLGIKFYPKVRNGSVIVVPHDTSEKKGLSTQEVIALSSVLSSITGITVAIVTLLK